MRQHIFVYSINWQICGKVKFINEFIALSELINISLCKPVTAAIFEQAKKIPIRFIIITHSRFK